MSKKDHKQIHYINKGRFVQVGYDFAGSEQRGDSDRRQSLRGDTSLVEDGIERRVGSRRLDDVIITLEIRDDKEVFATYRVFKEIVKKTLNSGFSDLLDDVESSSQINIDFGTKEVFIECKKKYRDKIKQLLTQKGLVCEVIDSGVYLGDNDSEGLEEAHSHIRDKKHKTPEKDSALVAVLGFSPEDLSKEIGDIIFKVFVKCLNEVHPVSGNYERDALKQDVSLEQRIIFIAGKHYPKTEKYNFKTIIEQVFIEAIAAYNQLIQVEADVIQLEERFQLSSDKRLLGVIQKKKEEVLQVRESTLEETIKTLYLYLDYFKDLIKVGIIKGRIENVFKKVNDKQVEVIQLEQIVDQLQSVIREEKKIKKRNPEFSAKAAGYVTWLKNEINREVYFARYLWINNFRGKAYIDDAVKRTLQAISPQ